MRSTTFRQGSAVLLTLFFSALVLGACGGDDDTEGSGDRVDVDAGGGNGGGSGDGGSPPTAGPGEAGVFTGPSGGEDLERETFVIPGCGDIDADSRLQSEEYEQLLAELQCIFDNRDRMPEGAVEEAEKAAELARVGIEDRENSIGTGNGNGNGTGTESTEPEPETTEPEPEIESETDTNTTTSE